MLEKFIHGTWKDLLKEEMTKSYFRNLDEEIIQSVVRHDHISPNIPDVFRAFNLCQYENTRVVIIGQDPYVDSYIADGLAFSCKRPFTIPPSLLNIYKAVKHDLGCYTPNHGCLDYWANQGVLLLNSMLTSYPDKVNNYTKIAWQTFTDTVVSILNNHERSLVFMLWGSYAHRKIPFIDKDRHLILRHNHPSPIIAGNTFVTCDHFSKCNQFLYETTPSVIDWQIPNVKESPSWNRI